MIFSLSLSHSLTLVLSVSLSCFLLFFLLVCFFQITRVFIEWLQAFYPGMHEVNKRCKCASPCAAIICDGTVAGMNLRRGRFRRTPVVDDAAAPVFRPPPTKDRIFLPCIRGTSNKKIKELLVKYAQTVGFLSFCVSLFCLYA